MVLRWFCHVAQSLKSRIDNLKRKHSEQLEQLALRQKQEMFIANAQFRVSEHRGATGARAGLAGKGTEKSADSRDELN